MRSGNLPPQGVPVLTEVVDLPVPATEAEEEYPPFVSDTAYADTLPAPLIEEVVLQPVPASFYPAPAEPDAFSGAAFTPMAPAPAFQQASEFDEAAVIQQVLADLDRQLDLMFEHRVRETLSPILARTTDNLVREMRNQLAVSLREMVARAVSLELDRQRKR